MKNLTKKYVEPIFKPCGLSIADEDFFKSARNLGVALAGALTGEPTENVRINACTYSIGLGAFSMLSFSADKEADDDTLEDEDTYWNLNSTIRYTLMKHDAHLCFSEKNVEARFDMLNLNIDPRGLLSEDDCLYESIQLFAPHRLLKQLKSADMEIYKVDHNVIGLGNCLECGIEESDAILTPSRMEFDLYCEEKDLVRKFRILLNMITNFASKLSAKLMHIGIVEQTFICSPVDDMFDELHWHSKPLDKRWVPTAEMATAWMKKYNMKKSQLDPEIRKLIWPKKK